MSCEVPLHRTEDDDRLSDGLRIIAESVNSPPELIDVCNSALAVEMFESLYTPLRRFLLSEDIPDSSDLHDMRVRFRFAVERYATDLESLVNKYQVLNDLIVRKD